ncbi:hypothetical protein HHI36_020774, partial [Cryptolaemus montrouzieri]
MLHVYWASTAFLTMFIVGVIIVLLKWGPQLCKVRHTALPDETEWRGKTYEQKA